jgi:HAMP domain-containing protein
MSERVVVAKAGIWQKVNGELTCVWEVQGKPLVCSDGSFVVQRWTNGHVFWGDTGRWSIEANTTPNDLFKWVCPLPSGESYSEQILGLNKQVLECKRERDKANDEIDRLNEECNRLANAKSQSEALRIEQADEIEQLQAELKTQVEDLDSRLSLLRHVNEMQQRERMASEKALMDVVKVLAKENRK